jgi:hypothetical protein
MKQILFFALNEDLLALFELIDSNGLLKYARMGNFRQDEINDHISVFESGSALPNLGSASADSSAACEGFLVCERETPIKLRGLAERFCVDQLANPDSVEFKPGGIWNEEIVLHGRIATASDSQISQALMKRFQAAAKKTFSKVKSFYVGQKAFASLESGKRLTISAQSPRDFDLTIGTD